MAGGTVYFSRVGHYKLNGPQITGEAFGYKYSGQILFPARTVNETQLPIEIKGAVSPTKPLLGTSGTEKTTEVPGVVLVSNAIEGNVFDVIPAFENSAGHMFSDLAPAFVDITVQVPPNPQCGAINMKASRTFRASRLRIEGPGETEGGVRNEAALTGSGLGLSLPGLENAGDILIEKLSVHGFPTALGVSEHCNLTYAFLGLNNCAIEMYGMGHANFFGYVDSEENVVTLRSGGGPTGGGLVYGLIDHENVVSTGPFAPGNFIEDAENTLRGEIRVRTEYGTEHAGVPQLGGLNLNVINLLPEQLTTGQRNNYASDNFLRGAIVAGNIGCCTRSGHPWIKQTGELKTKNEGSFGKLTLAKNEEAIYLTRNVYQGNGSRIIRTEITPTATGANANVGPIIGKGSGKSVWVRFREGKLQILGAAGGVVAEVAQAGGTLVDLSVVVNCPQTRGEKTGRSPVSVQAFINGVEKVSWTLTTAEREAMALAETVITFEDGIKFNKDLESSVQWFEIKPLLGAPTLPASVPTASATENLTVSGNVGAVQQYSTRRPALWTRRSGLSA